MITDAGFTTASHPHVTKNEHGEKICTYHGVIRLYGPPGFNQPTREIWRSEKTYQTEKSAVDHAEKHLLAVLRVLFAGSME